MLITLLNITALLSFISLVSFAVWFAWPWISHWREMMNPLTRAKAELSLEREALVIEAMRASITRQHTEIHMLQVRHVGRDEALVNVSDGSFYQNLTLHASPQQMLQLPEPASEFDFTTSWIGILIKQAKQAQALHMLLFGSRNSGKSTFLNYLMNEHYSTGFDITLVDPVFNKEDSGWLLPQGANISKDFVEAVTQFYQSHKTLVDMTETSRQGQGRKILIIDEAPGLLKSLKAADKPTHTHVMAMLRSIYSNGSHTNHSLILLSQTVLCEDLDLSSNDKGNFIQICLGSLSGEYLASRRGKTSKKHLYERLAVCSLKHDYFAAYEDYKGLIDINPLPDLSQYGAKRLYNGQAVSTVPAVFGGENPRSTTVLQPFSSVPLSPQERIAERVKEMYEKQDLDIAECILAGMKKTPTREKVGGNTQATGKRYDEIKAEIEAEMEYINDTQGQRLFWDMVTGQISQISEEEQQS